MSYTSPSPDQIEVDLQPYTPPSQTNVQLDEHVEETGPTPIAYMEIRRESDGTMFELPLYDINDMSQSDTWFRAELSDGTVVCAKPVDKTGEVIRSRRPSDGQVYGLESQQQ